MVGCSVQIVCPSVLSCSNLKLHQTLDGENSFIEENIMLQLTFNPRLMLTRFRTTRPWASKKHAALQHLKISLVIVVVVFAFLYHHYFYFHFYFYFYFH